MPTSRSLVPLAAKGFALTLTIGTAAPLLAQEAAPESGTLGFPTTSDPADCQVQPRRTDDLLALWYTPEGDPLPAATPMLDATSVTIPLGPRADEAMTAAVTAVASEIFGCFAAGDFARATTVFTDDLTRRFGGEPGTSAEQVRAFIAASPIPLMVEEPDQIVSISDAMSLSDGRLGTIFVDRAMGQQDAVSVILENQRNCWLVAEIIDFAPVE